MWQKFALVFLVVMLGACAGSSSLLQVSPLASEDQNVVTIDGSNVIQSSGDDVSVWASADQPTKSESGYLLINLSYVNHSRTPFEIIPSELSAHDESGNAIKILSFEELTLALEDMYKIRKVDMASERFGSSFQNTGVGLHTGTQGSGSSGSELTQHDVQRNTNRLNTAIAEEKKLYLHEQTLSPGQSHTGRVWLELPEGQTNESMVIMDITAGNKTHKFQFLIKTGS